MKHILYIYEECTISRILLCDLNATNNDLKVVSGTNFLAYTIYLTLGNYNLTALKTEINSKFSQVNFPNNPTITQNKSTGRPTFNCANNTTILASQLSIRDISGLGN